MGRTFELQKLLVMTKNILGVNISIDHEDLLKCKTRQEVSALNHFEHLDDEWREFAENELCEELGIKDEEPISDFN